METQPAPSAVPTPPASASPEAPESPYKNLMVPLVVVPAMIVVVLVVVFVLFGAVAGKESSPRDNLKNMLEGGKNERKQAAFSLVRQINEHRTQLAAGEQPTWDIGPDFAPALAQAYERSSSEEEDGLQQRYICAMLLYQLGEPQAIDRLLALLALPDAVDTSGQLRFDLLTGLGSLGGQLVGLDRQRALDAILPFTRHSDAGLALAAAIALQNYPEEASRAALLPLLDSSDFDLRSQAAISLAHHGDRAGLAVLRQMLEPATYEEVRRADPHKYAKAALVSRSRRVALENLLRLDPAGTAELLGPLAAGDPDLELRELARKALERPAGS